MKNIHLLPTQKPSKLHFDDKLFLSTNYLLSKGINSIVEGRNYKSFNIYITSDEEIKEGDWFLNDMNILFKAGKNYIENPAKEVYIGHKKIILTTDQDLINDGVQAIDDDFLEWFVKNPSCEDVEIESKVTKDGVWTDLKGYVELPTTHSIIHKIIIPKEEPKKVGEYQQELFSYLHDLGITALQSEMQEIERIVLDMQQEQDKNKYSEEEIIDLLLARDIELNSFEGIDKAKKWFEKFKKK